MSDGNFNRALLPKNELAAGLRAGKAQMRSKAEQAFGKMMDELFPDMTAEQKADACQKFMALLRQ